MAVKKVVLKINKKDIQFNVNPEDHETLINETQPDNKVAPMHNFLMRTVDTKSKDDLKKLLEYPTNTLQIATSVIQEVAPDIKITVGE